MDYYRCPNCKTENEEYVKYCKKCGTWLLSETYPALKVKHVPVMQKTAKVFGKAIFTIVILVAIVGAIVYFTNGDGQRVLSTSSTNTTGFSRDNPVLLGHSVTFELTQGLDGNENEFLVTAKVDEIKRGPEALYELTDKQYTEPEDGNEYLIARVTAKVDKSGNENTAFIIDQSYFSLVSSDGKEYPNYIYDIKQPIDAKLYAGAENDGWVVFQVAKDDPNPLIVMFGGIWFSAK